MDLKLGRIRTVVYGLAAVVPAFLFIVPILLGIVRGGGSGGG